MIVDLTLMIYDQGMLTRAAHVAARQTSLYWVDLDTFDPDDPPNDHIKLDPDRVADVTARFGNVLKRQANGTAPSLAVSLERLTNATDAGGTAITTAVPQDEDTFTLVTLDLDREAIGLTSLLRYVTGRAQDEKDLTAAVGSIPELRLDPN